MNSPTLNQLVPPRRSHNWPAGAVVYQIYPRSFQDSDGDGVGDLRGIISRLDYLKDLGVTAIWLSPFYPSPMVDFGYDITDHCGVDPLFGTLADFRQLLKEAHDREIKVLVDLVANHTSSEHPWFKESRSSRNNSKADWYIWKDAKKDATTGELLPPNNWREGLAGTSAWEWDDTRQQYYLHSWHKMQPDLNWSNKAVREEIKNIVRFWLDIGVDGFRADAVDWIAKDPQLRDDSPNPDYAEGHESPYNALIHNRSRGLPTEYSYLAEITNVFKERRYKKRQLFMIAEVYQERRNHALSYIEFYKKVDPNLVAPFNFEGLYLEWDASCWRSFLRDFHGRLASIGPAVPSYAFGNHDNPRIVTRFGVEASRSIALLQMTLPGMAIVYYGEEIGMENASLPSDATHDLNYKSRDPERTPMQWSAGKHAGFSNAGTLWLPLAPGYKTNNVESQVDDPQSFYNLYRDLMHFRATMPALRFGSFTIHDVQNPDVLCFVRAEGSEQCVVLINFSDKPALCIPDVPLRKLLISTKLKTNLTDLANGTDGHIKLLPNEAALFLQ